MNLQSVAILHPPLPGSRGAKARTRHARRAAPAGIASPRSSPTSPPAPAAVPRSGWRGAGPSLHVPRLPLHLPVRRLRGHRGHRAGEGELPAAFRPGALQAPWGRLVRGGWRGPGSRAGGPPGAHAGLPTSTQGVQSPQHPRRCGGGPTWVARSPPPRGNAKKPLPQDSTPRAGASLSLVEAVTVVVTLLAVLIGSRGRRRWRLDGLPASRWGHPCWGRGHRVAHRPTSRGSGDRHRRWRHAGHDPTGRCA